jgi:hypothetical protein
LSPSAVGEKRKVKVTLCPGEIAAESCATSEKEPASVPAFIATVMPEPLIARSVLPELATVKARSRVLPTAVSEDDTAGSDLAGGRIGKRKDWGKRLSPQRGGIGCQDVIATGEGE